MERSQVRDHQVWLGESNNDWIWQRRTEWAIIAIASSDKIGSLNSLFLPSSTKRVVVAQRIYRTAPLLEQTSYRDVESMILACASSFSCDPPRGPLLFRAIGPSSCRFIACKRFFLSCPFARTIFARSHYHSYTRAPALFRKFHSANLRARWSIFLCFHLLYHCYANRDVRYFTARYIYGCAPSLFYFLTAPI